MKLTFSRVQVLFLKKHKYNFHIIKGPHKNKKSLNQLTVKTWNLILQLSCDQVFFFFNSAQQVISKFQKLFQITSTFDSVLVFQKSATLSVACLLTKFFKLKNFNDLIFLCYL